MKKVTIKPKFHSLAAVVIVALTAVTGVISLHLGLAATPTGDIYIHITDTRNGQSIPGVLVYLGAGTSSTGNCKNMQATTNSGGNAMFLDCDVYVVPAGGVYYIQAIDTKPYQYEFTSDSPKRTGNDAGGQVTTAAGWQAGWQVNMTPIDRDHDGVPNNAIGYPVDQCATVAGTLANGCPPPPPVVSTPQNPTPPSTNTNPATPTAPSNNNSSSGGTSSSTKKTTSTTTKKVTSTSSSPAVIASTGSDKSPPTLPGSLSLSADDNATYLTWLASTDNVAITGYTVERSVDQKHWTTVASKTTKTYYSDVGLDKGTHYYYRVRALDAAGNVSEGALVDIKLVSAKTETAAKPAHPITKKSGGIHIVPILVGVSLILVASYVSFWLFRRHIQKSDDYSSPVPQTTNQLDTRTAEHTSISLAQLVMQDMRDHKDPPGPTPPPQA